MKLVQSILTDGEVDAALNDGNPQSCDSFRFVKSIGQLSTTNGRLLNLK